MVSAFFTRLETLLHLKHHVPHVTGWKLYAFVSLILLCETAALSFLQEYSNDGQLPFLIGGFLGYALVSTFLIQSYKYEGMGIVNVLWSAFSVLFVVFAGMFFFGEKVSATEWCGTILVIAGVVILRLPAKKKKRVRGGQCLHLSSSDVPSLS